MKKKRTYNRLTPERVEFLKTNYLFLSDDTIAKILGYNDGVTVRKTRQLLGLKRDQKAYKNAISDIPILIWVPKTETNKENKND